MDEASIYAGFVILNKPAEITAEWVRENFPESSKIADHNRAVFGDGVKLTACEENGKKLGKFTDPNEYQGERTRELMHLGLDKDGKRLPAFNVIGQSDDQDQLQRVRRNGK